MKQVFLIGAVLLMTLSSQASTKIFFKQKGTFVISDDGKRVGPNKDYTIQSVSGRIYSETASDNKAFGAWKNCYENKREVLEFPIPWKQNMYDPFVDWFDVNLSITTDQNEKSITVDEDQIADLITQSTNKLNQKTAWKCQIKSVLLARVFIRSADGEDDSFLIKFAVKNGTLFVRYSADYRTELTIALPNEGNPIPVIGNKL